MRATLFDLKTTAKALAGISVLACGLSVATSLPARALDDGQQNIFETLLGFIMMNPVDRNDKAAEIDYRERAPLVLPPKMDLRQPQEPGSTRSASWPQDPDVLKHKKAMLEASRAKGSPAKGNDVLSKQELNTGRYATTDSTPQQPRCGDNQHNCLYVNPDVLRAGGEFEPTKTVAVGEEPEREYLTQPPKGYRVATKKVEATFDTPAKVKDETADPKAYIARSPSKNNPPGPGPLGSSTTDGVGPVGLCANFGEICLKDLTRSTSSPI